MIVRRPKAKLIRNFRKVILNVARFIEEIFLAITGLNLDRKRSFGQTLFSVLSPEETQGNCRASGCARFAIRYGRISAFEIRSLPALTRLYVDHSHCPVLAPATLAALPSTRAIPDRDVFYVAHPIRSIQFLAFQLFGR